MSKYNNVAEQLFFNCKVMPDGCWRWLKSVNNDGYGQLTIISKTKRAHRAMFELVNSVELKSGECVLHKCDNPRCINPEYSPDNLVKTKNSHRICKICHRQRSIKSYNKKTRVQNEC